MALYINEDEVRGLVTMKDALDAVEGAFKHWGDGKAANDPRRRLTTRAGSIQVMTAIDAAAGVAGHKTYGGRNGNFVTIFDLASGDMLAMIAPNRLGQLRTGAASGVATKYMARQDATTLGVVGAGFQAETQVEAVCAVRPIKRIRVFGRDPEKREAFAGKMREQVGVDVVPVNSAEEAVSNADIICTITSSRTPVVQGIWLRDGQHINAAGSNSLLRQEIDDNVVSRAHVIAVDHVAQVDLEGGDLLSALQRGFIARTHLVELAHVVSGRTKTRTDNAQVTLFKSHGIGLEDEALAHAIYKKAKQQGVGVELPF
jgi:ornithine cyclodeaminase/alanine dehydrogenase-like protein (mu-crystallin family)